MFKTDGEWTKTNILFKLNIVAVYVYIGEVGTYKQKKCLKFSTIMYESFVVNNIK